MKKVIPMSALFATTMMAASDVSARTLNGMFNDRVNKYNPEDQTGTIEVHRISIASINGDIF